MSAFAPIPCANDLSVKPQITASFDAPTNTVTHVVCDPVNTSCAVINSVVDFDYAAGRITYALADAVIDFIRTHGLTLEWLIETHVHADRLSGVPDIRGKLGGKIGIGHNITMVQDTFGKGFNEGTEFQREGGQFDRLFQDGDTYQIGTMTVCALHTPGHTPACMPHVIGDATFVGDALFMPDGGSARADFPWGVARTLFRSIKRVLSSPDETRLFMCHDYGPYGREIPWETTVAEQNAHNIPVRDGVTKDQVVAVRVARDATLTMPKLIIPALQVYMRGGDLPEAEASGRRFLKVPINGL